MPLQINLLGFDCEVVDVPPLPQTGGKPGKGLMFTDKTKAETQVCYPMSVELADELGKELCQKPGDGSEFELANLLSNGGKK